MATPLTINLSINGSNLQPVSVADSTEPLLYVLRNQLGLHGPKYGCGVSQCGACTVEVNGVATRSCVTPLSAVAQGARITTLEGVTGAATSSGHAQEAGAPIDVFRTKAGLALQKAFVENQAAQCGYCANSVIMGSYVWLRTRIRNGNPSTPTDDEVKNFLSGVGQTPPLVYLCRCGTHLRIIRAIQQAATEMHS